MTALDWDSFKDGKIVTKRSKTRERKVAELSIGFAAGYIMIDFIIAIFFK